MSQPAEPRLLFGITDRPAGFTTSALSSFDGSPEPVVRELLQNALNAAQEAGRTAEVTFTITEVPASQVPGWAEYWHKFDATVSDRQAERGEDTTNDERSIVSRIAASRAATVRLLMCADNGHGLNPKRMDGLLTPGNSGNTGGGVGSFGLGHHMAFTASAMRYVLYGSRYRNDRGEASAISGGHAILATHRTDAGVVSADGYLVPSGDQQLPFDGSGGYPIEVPPMLASHLAADTGTVVCVVGFNEFNNDPEEDDLSSDLAIVEAAASNFTAAIASRNLRVTVVRDSSVGSPLTERIDDRTLGTHLSRISGQHRAWRQGHVRGVDAHRAHQTITFGTGPARLVVDGKAVSSGQVTVRYLLRDNSDPEAARGPTRVHLFRRGMWITSDARGLAAAEFTSKPPFDATVEMHSGDFEEVVRSAEGPEHRGLQTKRLSNDQKSDLRRQLAAVAECLNAAIEDRPSEDDWEPDSEWAQLLQGEANTVRKLEVINPRPPTGPVEPEEPPPDPPVPNPPSPTPDPPGPVPPKIPHEPGVPRPGERPDYAVALRSAAGATEMTADVHLKDERIQALGVRVVAANGSDSTCEQQLPVRYLKLVDAATSCLSAGIVIADNTGCEIVLPAQRGRQRLHITLATPVDDPNSIDLDLVRRSLPPSPQPQTQAA